MMTKKKRLKHRKVAIWLVLVDGVEWVLSDKAVQAVAARHGLECNGNDDYVFTRAEVEEAKGLDARRSFEVGCKAVLWPRCGAVPVHRAVDRQPCCCALAGKLIFGNTGISQTPTGPAAKKAIKLGGLVCNKQS